MEQQNPEEKIKEIQFDILNQAPLLGKYAILMKETKYSPRLFTHEFQKRIFKNILATTLCLPTQELSNSLIYHISPL